LWTIIFRINIRRRIPKCPGESSISANRKPSALPDEECAAQKKSEKAKILKKTEIPPMPRRFSVLVSPFRHA
jgi:hypothetical protein